MTVKRLLMMSLIILILIIPTVSRADDRLLTCEKLLFQKDIVLKATQEELLESYKEINRLILEKSVLINEIDTLHSQIGNHTGLYAGAVIGYPFFTGLAIIEYRFPRWSPIIVGGYSQSAFIGAGINIKVGK